MDWSEITGTNPSPPPVLEFWLWMGWHVTLISQWLFLCFWGCSADPTAPIVKNLVFLVYSFILVKNRHDEQWEPSPLCCCLCVGTLHHLFLKVGAALTSHRHNNDACISRPPWMLISLESLGYYKHFSCIFIFNIEKVTVDWKSLLRSLSMSKMYFAILGLRSK